MMQIDFEDVHDVTGWSTEYVAMPRPIVVPVQLWRVIMSLYTFQNTERFFYCCCRGWHCRQTLQYTMAIRMQVFAY